MALFQRKDMISPITLKYSLSTSEKKKLVVGLGNPGSEYDGTRHNFGFMAIDKLAEHYDVTFVTKKDQKCKQAIVNVDGDQIILAKPETYMNESGQAVRALMDYYQVPISQVLVVYDELDLTLGDIRLKRAGSSAGHNGIKSIIKHCGEDFFRLRLGIGPKTPEQMDSADFVLQKFAGPEKRRLPKLLTTTVEHIENWVTP